MKNTKMIELKKRALNSAYKTAREDFANRHINVIEVPEVKTIYVPDILLYLANVKRIPWAIEIFETMARKCPSYEVVFLQMAEIVKCN